MSERRRFSRIPFEVRAVLEDAGRNWPVDLLDISLKGALLGRPEAWEPALERPCRLQVELGEGAVIHMEGAVAHLHADRVGFRCDHLDLDSITHLRRLAELNLGDVALVERELAALGASRQ